MVPTLNATVSSRHGVLNGEGQNEGSRNAQEYAQQVGTHRLEASFSIMAGTWKVLKPPH